jgi:hypothetical protein
VVEELRATSIATITVGDLAADQDTVLVTRRGGFLSAAAERLRDAIRRNYAGRDVSVPQGVRKKSPARKVVARRRLA